MSSSHPWWLLLVLPAPAFATAPPPLLRDHLGDPLPPGAVARLDTARYRQGEPVWCAAFSADGKRTASGGEGGSLYLWEAHTGREINRFEGHTKKIDQVLFTRDGKTLVSASDEDASVRIWDAPTARQRHALPLPRGGVAPGRHLRLGLSRDGKTLVAVGWKDGAIVRWDTVTGKELSRVRAGKGDSAAFAVSPDGATVVVSRFGAQPRLELVEAATGRETGRLPGHKGALQAAAFSADAKLLATAGLDQSVRIWRLDGGKELARFTVRGVESSFLGFSPDGKRVVWTAGGRVSVFEVPEGKAEGKQERQFSVSRVLPWDAAALSPDGKRLLLPSWRGALAEWDLATGKQSSAPPLGSTIKGVLAGPDSRTLYSAGVDTTVRVWDLATGKERRRLGGHGGVTFGAVCTRDGKHVATGSTDGVVRLWEAATGKELAQMPGQNGGMEFTPDGKALITSDLGGVLRWWDVPSGKRRTETLNGPGFASSLVFSPDKHLLAVCGYGDVDAGFRLCGPEGQVRHPLGKAGEAVLGMCFSPDSRTLASWGHRSYGVRYPPDGSTDDYAVSLEGKPLVRLFESTTGKMRAQLDRLSGEVRSVALSPDGRTLAAGCSDGSVVLWDLLEDREWGRFHGHRGGVGGLDFTPDGRMLISGGNDGGLVAWDMVGRRPPSRRLAALSAQELKSAWADLGGEDAGKAYRAFRALARAPARSVPWLRERLRPTPGADEARLKKLIDDLGADAFAVREKASRELEKMEERAAGALRSALESQTDLEVRRRIERILRKIDRPAPSREQLLVLRAIEVLESAGTEQARKVLGHLAGGAPGARVTLAAKSALARMAQRTKGR
jgi:WD40 repeat protein